MAIKRKLERNICHCPFCRRLFVPQDLVRTLIVLISGRSIRQHDQNKVADTILADARHFDVRSL